MLKKKDLKKGKFVYKDRITGGFSTTHQGQKFKLVEALGEPISFIPNCFERGEQDLNCETLAEQSWLLEDEEGVFIQEKIIFKLGRWHSVYKRYFNIVSWALNEDE